MKKFIFKYFTVFILCIVVVGCVVLNCDSSDSNNYQDTGIFVTSGQYEGEYWPTNGWRTCKPEEVGMDSEKLMDAYDYIAQPDINTEGTVIIKNGYIIAEAYFDDFTINSRHHSYSVAKSFTSAVVGIAMDESMIGSINDKVFNFFPEWQTQDTQPEKQNITIRHLLTMSSGLEWDEYDYYGSDAENDAYQMGSEYDYIQYVLAKPVVYGPGTHWCYSSGDSMLLSGIIQHVTGSRTYDIALEKLLQPIGLPDLIWYSDPAGHTIGGWGINATVREYAKFGYLYLNYGCWDGQQLVSENWVRESTNPAYVTVPFYGYQWWLLPALDGYQSSDIPSDTYLAWGIYTQQIFVIPEHDLLIVRVANDPGSDQWQEVEFLTLVLDCLI